MDRIVLLKGGRQSGFGFKNRKIKEPTPPKPPPPPRDEQIRTLREEGKTFQTIAGRFGLSIARVQQICKKEDR